MIAIVLMSLVTAQAPGQVAVLVEPGMVNYGGMPSLQPERILALLTECGIKAVALGAAAAADPAVLNTARFSAIVLPYGNAFPLPAFENLRAFHRAGGCLVMSGVPFCHPCTSVAPMGWSVVGTGVDLGWGDAVKWTDEGHGGSRRAVRVVHKGGDWTGVDGPALPAKPGEKFILSGWVRSKGVQAGKDSLFVRRWNTTTFLGQDGPNVPVNAPEWTYIEKEITAPEHTTNVDVSLQVWTDGATVDVDDISLIRVDDTRNLPENLAANGGFEQAGGQWKDVGHEPKYFAHDSFGIGTGGFGGPTAGNLVAAKGNVLGMVDKMLAHPESNVQWFDRGDLAAEDEVLTVVEVRGADGVTHPASALVRHNCREFNGARDVWIGQLATEFSGIDRYTAEQMTARGVAWCLKEKGAIVAADVTRVAKVMDARAKPKVYANLEIVDTPRPWGDSFYPKSKPPARQLTVVDARPVGLYEKVALMSLQALTSRDEPRIWLLFSDWDQRWLDWHKTKGYIDGYKVETDLKALFRREAKAYKGVVVPDTGLYQGILLACDLAAVEDLIVASPELAKELGIPVVEDLRGKFKTYAAGMDWLWTKYHDRFNHHLCAYAHPNTAYTGLLAYDMQMRGVIFWISGEKDGSNPGADPIAEMDVMGRIFSEMPPNIGMRGFPWAGEGIGLGEGGGVDFCGGFGKGLTCMDHTANVCVMSGVKIDHLVQPVQPPAPPLERDKVYVAYTMSDGDNLNTAYDYFPNYFEHPAHGEFPMGWGMGPSIIDQMPAVAQWYFEHAKPTDEFLADVSGIFYVFPQTYGNRYRERWKVFDGFVKWTGQYMAKLGERTVRPHGGDDDRMARYAKGIPFMHSIFADYAYRGGLDYDHLDYTLAGGMPVIHAATGWTGGADGLLPEIRQRVGTTRPAFVNAFLCNWFFSMDQLKAIYEGRDKDMVFVTPAQMAELYKAAKAKGWAK